MITAEEKTQERFPDRNNRDNLENQNHRNIRHQERKHGPDNTVAVLTNQGSFPNLEGMTTLKTCIASGTLKEITPSEIATPSMIDTQEKIGRETLKKTIRKR